MSTEANKALVRRFYEESGTEGIPKSRSRCSPTTTCATTSAPRSVPGPAGQKQIADDFRTAFPDLRVTVDLIVGEEDFVVGRWTATGTHTGNGAISSRPAADVTFSAANIWRFEDGKAVEIWNHRDDLGLMEQLGVEVHAGARPEE